MGARLLANKPFTNGKRNRANTVSRKKEQGACLQTQKSHFSLLVRAHKGMNIHCPIFSAVCFIYLFKWFLSLCLSNPLLRFSLFFSPMYSCTKAQLKSKSSRCVFYHKVSDSVHGTKKSEEWCLALEQEAIVHRMPPKPNERSDYTSILTIRVAKHN